MSTTPHDERYFKLLADALHVCARYRPMFGKGRKGGLTLAEFQAMYQADPFYNWVGLDSPLMYAAHKASGGMTSIYRQLGKGCERIFVTILQDHLGLTEEQATWSYEVPGPTGGPRTLSLDGRIPVKAVRDRGARKRVADWMSRACDQLGLDRGDCTSLHGAVFEVRQGYKSMDAKRTCDARDLVPTLGTERYAAVVTSPPYPNRMSYIRELRPYMYWLGQLTDGRAAGELDWQAIGGTWGCATSNVGKWSPPTERKVPFSGFDVILGEIAKRSPLLSRYVHKYFYDMLFHVDGLFRVVAPGGHVHYIVGNSKFYDVLLPVEQVFASLFEAVGFVGSDVRAIRKRTSKKELFEYVVSARKPVVPRPQAGT